MKKFVLVTATCSEPGLHDVTSAGIRKLKRGTTLDEFITAYLNDLDIWDAERLERGDSTIMIVRTPERVVHWAFTTYKEDDLFDAVKHLTREELLRDIKELLPLKNNPMQVRDK